MPHLLRLVAIWALAVLASCAGRRFEPAASPQWPDPPPAVTVLQSDPPLPGEALGAWSALDPGGGAPRRNPGEGAGALGVDRAVELALQRHPELAAVAHEVRAAQRRRTAAGRLPDPELEVFPGTEPLVVGVGERVRIRLGNLSPMDHHPIHLHGLAFEVTATDGGVVPVSARYPETTVLVPVGSTRVIEFVPTEPGDWAMHCHMTHHVMTQMGHGLPNMVGAVTAPLDRRMSRVLPEFMSMGAQGMGGMGEMEMAIPENSLPMRGARGPFSYIDMGGMFTVLKVREQPETADPAAWYEHPPGTVAGPADPARLQQDGVQLSF